MGRAEGAMLGFLVGLRVGLCLGAFVGLRVGLEKFCSSNVLSLKVVNTASSVSGSAGDASEVNRPTTKKMTASAGRSLIF